MGTALPGAGGTIKGSAGSMLVTQNASGVDGVFSGLITDSVSLVKAGGNTLFLTTANNYTGATVVTGGTLRVRDDGALANTSSVTVNFGTLLLDNSNLSDNLNRLNDSAGITLNGGTLSLFGRAGALSSETVGVVTLGIGANTISASTGNNGGQYPPQTGILRVGGLVRDASTGSTLTFSQNYTNTSAGQMGTISGNQENIVINGYNSGMLTNNIMGAWAVANSGYFNTTSVEYASYIDGLGVGALSTTGYAGYTSTLTNPATPVTGTATSNVRVVTNNSTAVQIASGGLTVNTLNVGNVAPSGTTTTGTNVNLTFAAATDVLNLAGGGLIIQNITGTNAAGTASIGTSSVQASSLRVVLRRRLPLICTFITTPPRWPTP
ncbi:autotransporter-associated beta strand repeat-containing protein [Verrucomicrobium spinosum]|uniref:autotransporter-associated beta strand repeat-containing protein n=1 Tax=Verrucomicrobium spinosum TaxID=2736 RepID=UPI0012E24220|nr:autotransporter-associated beta strand repeat-containing protein [Verrucomicrobium spinosum]